MRNQRYSLNKGKGIKIESKMSSKQKSPPLYDEVHVHAGGGLTA